MSTRITLAKVHIVVTGALGPLDPEDVKWQLIARGASIMTSVTKATGALVAGEKPKPKLVEKARQLGIAILDLDGLKALLGGASVQEAVAGRGTSGDAGGKRSDLAGKRVAISGKWVGLTKGSLSSTLEGFGATVVKKVSKRLDLLVVGDDPSFDAIDAMDGGVPFLRRPALDALLTGTPLTDFVGAPGPAVKDPAGVVQQTLETLHEELVGPASGERWEDELTVSLRPDGKVVAELRELGGTPVHDRVREVLQRQSWPKVTKECTVSVSIVFV